MSWGYVVIYDCMADQIQRIYAASMKLIANDIVLEKLLAAALVKT